MPWGTDKRLMDLLDLANRKGYVVTKAILRDLVRLTDPEGRRVIKDGGVPHSALPNRGGSLMRW